MNECAEPAQVAGRFVVYDEASRITFDHDARRVLDQLNARFRRVEVKNKTKDPKESWCVRVSRHNRNGESPLPLAAIGTSAQQAAERLWRISTFF